MIEKLKITTYVNNRGGVISKPPDEKQITDKVNELIEAVNLLTQEK